MSANDLNQIKGNYWITCNEKYVVLRGKKLYVFRHDGSLVWRRADLKNVWKVSFLPDDRLLTDGGNTYRILSLADGRDIWCYRQGKSESKSDSFAISPDRSFAFDICDWMDQYRVVRIDLRCLCAEEFKVASKLRVTKDALCDATGSLNILQTQYDQKVDGQVSTNGVLCWDQRAREEKEPFTWKDQWEFDGRRISSFFLGDTETILTNDLHVFHRKTQKMYYLLENDINTHLPRSPLQYGIDLSGKYVTLMYDNENVVIDWQRRKVVARYAGQGTQGCLIGNHFWISSENGIQRKPFPLMEEALPQKYVFWKPY